MTQQSHISTRTLKDGRTRVEYVARSGRRYHIGTYTPDTAAQQARAAGRVYEVPVRPA